MVDLREIESIAQVKGYACVWRA